MVPIPPIVAVVEAELALLKVIDPELEDQEEKPEPVLGVAVMERGPEFSQTSEPHGLVNPLPVAAKVT
jgi:hypothetical protein